MSQKTNVKTVIMGVVFILVGAFLLWVTIQMAQMHKAQLGSDFRHSQMAIQHADGSKSNFNIELATTPMQQERGLMFRKELAANAGMLFIWPDDQLVTMWMKNTLIPLDMLYIDHDRVITKITANAAPEDLTLLPSDRPIRAVVEIPGGEAAKQNIRVGDKILFPNF